MVFKIIMKKIEGKYKNKIAQREKKVEECHPPPLHPMGQVLHNLSELSYATSAEILSLIFKICHGAGHLRITQTAWWIMVLIPYHIFPIDFILAPPVHFVGN